MKLRVLIVSGGSGGHIFPAIAVCRELLKREGVDIIFAASRRRLDMELLAIEPFQKTYFTYNPMPRRPGPAVFGFLFKALIDAFKSIYILLRYRPGVVAGFGGYTGAPLMVIASMLGIPALIHEQNYAPGRANKALDKFANRVCVSFEESKAFFKNKNVIYTGNPIRLSLLEDAGQSRVKSLGLDPERFTVLVMGGSQGARSLNRLATGAIEALDEGIKRNLQVIHIAGRYDYDIVKKVYEKINVKNLTHRFIENIENAYASCDLAISRSGAAACFELAFFKKPMVLIPFPRKDNNQRSNAMFFSRSGACIYREEEGLSPTELKDIIEDLIKNESKRKELSSRAAMLARPEAAGRLASEIMGLCKSC